MKKKRRRRKRIRRTSKRKIQVGIVLGSLLFLIYLAGTLFYTWHFYQRTAINGVKCSNLSLKKAEEVISTQVREYTLTIEEREEKTEQIKGKEIGLKIYFDGGLDRLKKKQNALLWPIGFLTKHNYEIGTMLNYDKDLLESFYNYLDCFKENAITAPENAHISEYDNGKYQVVKEVQGNLVKKDEFYEIVKKAIMALDDTVSIEKEHCYEEPSLLSDNEALNNAVKEMNQLVRADITYEFGDDKEVVDGERIHNWIKVDKDFNVSLDQDKVKEFVDYIGKNYNSFGRVRTLKTSYGQTIKVSGGDYGWWLDRATERTELIAAIKAVTQGTREPAYYQTASQFGDDDVGDTYVEINLTAQHLYFYKDGELVVDSDFVSGNVTKGNGTPVGTYPIQYKQKDATLVGEDYETPVSFWMPFNGNIGLHDAPWRSDFGKDIYMTSGSHGCINLPPKVAKKIYEGISRGVGVYVYELPGTENYIIDPNKMNPIGVPNQYDNQYDTNQNDSIQNSIPNRIPNQDTTDANGTNTTTESINE